MKRVLLILLAIAIFCNGCFWQGEDHTTADPVIENLEEADYTSKDSKIFLYEGTAIYETAKNGIYYIFSLELGSEQPVLLGKGRLLALFKSILLAKNDTHYIAMDVSKSSTWIELESMKTETAYLQWNEKGLIFSRDEEKFYVDVIDLANLAVARREIEDEVLDALVLEGNLYYISAAEKTVLCEGTLSGKTKVLCEVDADRMYGAGTHILFQKEGNTSPPRLYDVSSETLSTASHRGRLQNVTNGMARYVDRGYVYFDISAGKTVDEERYNTALQNAAIGYAENATDGINIHFKNCVYRVNFEAWISWTFFQRENCIIGEEGMAYLSTQFCHVSSVKWSAENAVQIAPSVYFNQHPFPK